MKKLMIIAAVAFAAVASNAATIKWNVSSVNDLNGQFMMDSGYSVLITVTSDTTTGSKLLGATDGGALDWGMANGTFATATSGTGDLYFSAVATAPDGSILNMGPYHIAVEDPDATYTASWAPNNKASDWQSVPEPTSGMLLLLGVAGLALRRRRA